MLFLLLTLVARICWVFPYDPGDPNVETASLLSDACDWSEQATEISLIATFACVENSDGTDGTRDVAAAAAGDDEDEGHVAPIWGIEIKREYMIQETEGSSENNGNRKRRKRSTQSRIVDQGSLTYDFVLHSYISWRNRHGYGRHGGRWGRDLRQMYGEQDDSSNGAEEKTRGSEDGILDEEGSLTDEQSSETSGMKKQYSADATNAISVDKTMSGKLQSAADEKEEQHLEAAMERSSRVKRKAEAASKFGSNHRGMRRMLRNYLEWRKTYGYGKNVGRWG